MAEDLKLLKIGTKLAALEELEERGQTPSGSETDQIRNNISSLVTTTFTTEDDNVHSQAQVIRRKAIKAMASRLAFAVFGGAMMIIPVLIMKLKGDLESVLLTMSLFTLFAAVLMAATLRKADDKDIIFANAAYAAVLVIFVANDSTNFHYSNDEYYHVVHELIGVVPGAILGAVLVIALIAAWLMYRPDRLLADRLRCMMQRGRTTRPKTNIKETKSTEQSV